MGKEKNLTLGALAGTAVLLAVVTALCMTFSLRGAFTPELGYFVKGAPIVTLLYCTLVLCVLLGTAAWLCFRKKRLVGSAPSPVFAKIPAAAVLLALLWRTAESILLQIESQTALAHKTLMAAGTVFGLLFVVALLCEMFLPQKQQSQLAALCTFFPPFYIATQLFLLYFDENMATNGSIKIIYQLMYVAFMLMYTAQAGLQLGRSKMLPRYLFCLCTTAALGGGISLSALMCVFANIPGHRFTLAQSVFCLAVSVYALVRLLAFICVPQDGWSEAEKASKNDK